jgi:hypothetical protein
MRATPLRQKLDAVLVRVPDLDAGLRFTGVATDEPPRR